MTISLKEITKDNWQEAIKLKVNKSQDSFVASNVYSIAESKFYPWSPMAIYHQDTMVGFLMYGEEDVEGHYCIIRLMIDKNHQGRGYGKAAMQQAIEQIKEKPGVKAILTSYEPDNEVAAKLYANLGFEKTGKIEYGEEVVQLKGVAW